MESKPVKLARELDEGMGMIGLMERLILICLWIPHVYTLFDYLGKDVALFARST